MKKTWHELLKNKLASRGDTIIEVMLAISIFALVLVVSLVSTNRSLHSGTDATNRDQALSLAQQQVEFIKNALGTDLQTLQSYVSAPQTFCINPANGAVQDASASNNPCNQFGGSQYDLAITHTTGADNTTVFKVTTTWPSSVSNTTDSAYVYYKVPKAGPNPPIISNCSVTVTSSTAPGAVTMAGHIDPNGVSTTWHFSYGTSTSLGTNLPVPDGGPLASPADVSQNVSGLSGGNYYFSLIATNTDGITNCSNLGTFTITTPPPPPAAPTVNLISVTHTTSNDTYHVRGTIDPNGTPNTHPYMSIGRTCDSGGDEDNPGVGTGNQKYNAALNKYENPKGPFSDSTTHNENADMADTQFSFYFCGHNDPYKFQQCAWWGTDISAWQANHACSTEIDLFSNGSTCSSNCGGGGGGGGTTWTCTNDNWGGYVDLGVQRYSDLFGNCNTPVTKYWAELKFYDKAGDSCGDTGIIQGDSPGDRFYYPKPYWRIEVTGWLAGYDSSGNWLVNSTNSSNTYTPEGSAC